MRLQFFSAFLLALSGSASPLIARNTVSVPLVRYLNFTGASKMIEADQARAKALKAKLTGDTTNAATYPVPVTNQVVSYIAPVRMHFLDVISLLHVLVPPLTPHRSLWVHLVPGLVRNPSLLLAIIKIVMLSFQTT